MYDIELGDVGTRLIYEDFKIRVWLLELDAGEASDWHKHQCDYVYVVTSPGAVQTEYMNASPEVQVDHRGETVYRVDRDVHRLVNIGSDRYQNVVVELLDI